jgi:agmatine/peptidylarginine deiminase
MSLSTIKHSQAHALEVEEATTTQGNNKQIRWLVTGLYVDTIHVHILDRTHFISEMEIVSYCHIQFLLYLLAVFLLFRPI